MNLKNPHDEGGKRHEIPLSAETYCPTCGRMLAAGEPLYTCGTCGARMCGVSERALSCSGWLYCPICRTMARPEWLQVSAATV